ncbi:MAG: hypothetical protein ABIS47_14445 [Acidimicrobiales bacterium]
MADLLDDRVLVPFVAGRADLELLQAVSPFTPSSLADHVAAVEEGGQELAEAGLRVDLVPVWAPLFLVWCEEAGIDPGAADALERWTRRDSLVSVSYTHYGCGPVSPLVELEEVRSWALRSVLADERHQSERAVASVWSTASAFLEVLASRSARGSELDVAIPTWSAPAHWHFDGSCCDDSSPTLDHVHAATMEGLAIDGSAILVEPASRWSPSLVRVWALSPDGIRPLSADEAADRCQPSSGAALVDAWGNPARR